MVAAGPNNVVELTNIVGRIFDKSGNDLSDFNLNTLFGVATDIFSSDPRIEYDTLSQRWFISFLTLDTTDPTTSQNGFWNLAVSKDSNPLDGFYTYQVETMGDFPDQPPLGFNDDKVVTGGNSFSCTVSTPDPGNPNCSNGDYEGNEFLVWNKSELLAGAAMIHTDYNPPGTDSSDFPIIPAKSRTSTSTLWMVSACVTGFSECDDMLNVWSVTGVPGVGGDSSASLTTLTTSRNRSSAGRATEGQRPAIRSTPPTGVCWTLLFATACCGHRAMRRARLRAIRLRAVACNTSR